MKKWLGMLLIMVFVLLPAHSVFACNTSNSTTAVKILCWPTNSQYTYYFTKATGTVKIMDQENIRINSNSSTSGPVIRINGVPLGEAYISSAPKTSSPTTTTTVPKTTGTPVTESKPATQPQSGIAANSMQSEMLGYINAERAKANLPSLVLDEKLCQGAALKSKDMAANGYFSHNSPTYGSPFDMMKSLGITYSLAGENIAKNTSVKGAHDAFMNSPGHRANILNSGFKKVGLGFYQLGSYIYVTQWFTN